MSDSGEDNLALDISEDFVPSRVRTGPALIELDFGGLLSPPLRLQEDVKEGNGGQAWPAGKTLTEYLLKHHLQSLKNKSIVDLGAGGGLVGLAVSQALGTDLSKPIYITDLPPMIPLIEQNLKLLKHGSLQSANEGTVVPLVYSWGEAPPDEMAANVPPDVVLAADCVYFEPAFPLLLKTLRDLIGRYTTCWFCFKRRRRADMMFAKQLKKQFRVVEVGVDDASPEEVLESEGWRRENIHV